MSDTADTCEENDVDSKLSNLVSIFNTTCSQFASVIYHSFRTLYGAIGKFTKGFQLIGPYKLCVIKQTLIANISIMKNYLLLYSMLKNSQRMVALIIMMTLLDILFLTYLTL